jgi:repressor LexA
LTNLSILYTIVYMKTKLYITDKELKAVHQIRNFLMHKGRAPSVRELMTSMGYRSPRSATLIIDKLIKKGVIRRKPDGTIQFVKNLEDDTSRAHTVDVPLIGTVACGMPVLAEENIEGMIPVSVKLAKPTFRYFLLKAKGDSMNQRGINNGDLVLVRQQVTAHNGDVVIALIDDQATIKEFHKSGETIILKPRSKNKSHKPIVLTEDFQVQGIVVASITEYD